MRIKQIVKAFTLIEVVMSIVIVSVISTGVCVFIYLPIKAHYDATKYSNYSAMGEIAMQRMKQEIRRSVPNSIRVKPNNNLAIEMMPADEYLHYRTTEPGNHSDILDFSATDDQFGTLTLFKSAHRKSHDYRIIIANQGTYTTNSDNPTAGENLYNPAQANNTHVITNAIDPININNKVATGHVVIPQDHHFAIPSPTQTAYFSKYPVSFICDLTAKTLTMYYNYPLTAVQPISPASSPLADGSSALLATNVQSCSFNYKPATANNLGVTTMTMTLGDGTNNFSLMQQVRLTNED